MKKANEKALARKKAEEERAQREGRNPDDGAEGTLVTENALTVTQNTTTE